jgi:hypothetical protein
VTDCKISNGAQKQLDFLFFGHSWSCMETDINIRDAIATTESEVVVMQESVSAIN